MTRGSARPSPVPLYRPPLGWLLTASGCLLLLLAALLSVRLVTEVDVLACFPSPSTLSSRCPVPRSTLSYQIAGAIASTANAGVGFSLVRVALILLGVCGAIAAVLAAGVSRLGAIIAGYGWLLLAEPYWTLSYPIILFPLLSWLWFLVRLRYRGSLGDWIWLPFSLFGRCFVVPLWGGCSLLLPPTPSLVFCLGLATLSWEVQSHSFSYRLMTGFRGYCGRSILSPSRTTTLSFQLLPIRPRSTSSDVQRSSFSP